MTGQVYREQQNRRDEIMQQARLIQAGKLEEAIKERNKMWDRWAANEGKRPSGPEPELVESTWSEALALVEG